MKPLRHLLLLALALVVLPLAHAAPSVSVRWDELLRPIGGTVIDQNKPGSQTGALGARIATVRLRAPLDDAAIARLKAAIDAQVKGRGKLVADFDTKMGEGGGYTQVITKGFEAGKSDGSVTLILNVPSADAVNITAVLIVE